MRMKPIHKIWMFQLLALVLAVLVAAWNPVQAEQPAAQPETESQSEPTQLLPLKQTGETEELVGVWVPYLSLDLEEKTEEAFCSHFDQIVEEAAALGINALFVHVRPFGDALYASAYYPWSHILTGEQGKDPGYDPLAYMIQKTHEAGLQFHAWINPLRISLGSTPASFSPDNPYIAWQADNADYFLRCADGIYYDPGYSKVREYITAGVEEIVEHYDVDGIHFDDYFYPADEPNADDASYTLYCDSVEEGTTPMSREDWRKSNINTLVSQVYAAVKHTNADVVFGISPTGVVSGNEPLSADVAAWCAVEGYVDYICPQLYFSTEDSAPVTFSQALEEWLALPRAENVKFYIGLAAYKAGSDVDNGAWQNQNDILAREIEQGRQAGANGFIFYAWDQVVSQQASEEIDHALAVLA